MGRVGNAGFKNPNRVARVGGTAWPHPSGIWGPGPILIPARLACVAPSLERIFAHVGRAIDVTRFQFPAHVDGHRCPVQRGLPSYMAGIATVSYGRLL